MHDQDIFNEIKGSVKANINCKVILKASRIPTPLGDMIAIADDEYLYYLGFTDSVRLRKKLNQIKCDLAAGYVVGSTEIINKVEIELGEYFNGKLRNFSIPLKFIGSEFQKQNWEQLMKLEYGKTASYGDIAIMLGRNITHARAVGGAAGANPIVIVVPCHRLTGSNQALGGFSCGLDRKAWLLKHETTFKSGA